MEDDFPKALEYDAALAVPKLWVLVGDPLGWVPVGDSEMVGNGFREENPNRRRESMMDFEFEIGPIMTKVRLSLALCPILVLPTFDTESRFGNCQCNEAGRDN